VSLNIFSWIFKKHKPKEVLAQSQAVDDFLNGDKHILTSEDIDPEGTALFEGYQKAMLLKKNGEYEQAELILLKSCEPPSIYKGHYRELFKIWRKYNRDDIKLKKYSEVSARVLKMVKLDEEMINGMLDYWGERQNKTLPKAYFDKDRNLLVSDAKALKKSSEILEDTDNLELAIQLIERFAVK